MRSNSSVSPLELKARTTSPSATMPRSPWSALSESSTTAGEPVLVRVAAIFSADVAGFSDAEDDDLAARFDRFFDQIDRAGKLSSEPSAQPLELGNFQIKHTSGLFNVIHRSMIVG